VLETVRPVDPPEILAFAGPLSAALDLKPGPPYAFLDSGAGPISYMEWTFVRKATAAGDHPEAIVIPPRGTVILSRLEWEQAGALPSPR
jgi:hypothetical protein